MIVTDLTFSYSLQISTSDPNAKSGIEANSGSLAGFKLFFFSQSKMGGPYSIMIAFTNKFLTIWPSWIQL